MILNLINEEDIAFHNRDDDNNDGDFRESFIVSKQKIEWMGPVLDADEYFLENYYFGLVKFLSSPLSDGVVYLDRSS